MLDQEELTDEQIAESIYTGVDCCEDSDRKGWNIHIYPGTVWAKPNQIIRLSASSFNHECSVVCVYWRILKGGGVFLSEFGLAVDYQAGRNNGKCDGSAVVGLFCGGNLMDTCKIGINEYQGAEVAYFRAGVWRDNYYPQIVYSGESVVDPATGEVSVVQHESTEVIKYVPDKYYYGDTKPEVSAVVVTEHRCDGTFVRSTTLAIRSVAVDARGNRKVLLPGRWIANTPSSLIIMSLYGGYFSFEEAKRLSLVGFMSYAVRVGIPTRYTVKPRLPSFRGEDEMKSYYEELSKYEMWMDYAKAMHNLKIEPGGFADLRTPTMIELGCCPPYLI